MSREMKKSGIEWIGTIPADWNVSQLRMFFGRRIHKNKELKVKNLLSLSYGNVIRKNIETKEGLLPESFDGYNIVEPGDIVIRGTDLQNDHRSLRTGLVTEHGIITSAYMTLMPITGVNSEYYHYLLHGYDLAKVFYSMGGGLRQSLDYWDFCRMLVLHPLTSEQRQIVHFLDRKCSAIDTAIEKTKESIEKLEEYKKSVITKAVTKGLDPDAKMKDSGVEWIGKVPEGWEIKQLRMFYSRRANKNKGLLEKNLLSLSYGNIIRKNIDTKEGLLPESFEGYNIVEKGDIVIRGTDLQNDHKSLRTGLVTERGIITSAYMTLMPKNDINSEYYHYLLHCYDIEKVFYSMGGGLRQSLEYWDFIRTPVLEPSKKEQEEIVIYIKDKCSAIDALITKKQEAISKWEEYKKSLIYYAVTGKIDCRNEAV